MKAIVYTGNNGLQLENIAYPEIEYPTDAIIKINLSAISGSDIQTKRLGLLSTGKVIGNEYCGTIAETGRQVSRFKAGDRVTGRPYYHCGLCYWCMQRQPRLCENGAVFGTGEINGVQAEYARIPYADETLVHIPDDIGDEDALLVCNVLSAGYTGLERANAAAGDTVAIFGDGPVGLSSAICASLFGAGIVMVVGHHNYRLEYARKHGAIAMDAQSVDAVAAIKGLTYGRGADVCIEATGSEEAFQQCLKSVRKGGRVNVLGTIVKSAYYDISEYCRKTITISMGPGESEHAHILLELIRNGKLRPRTLVTHRMPLSEALNGYKKVESRMDEAIVVIIKG